MLRQFLNKVNAALNSACAAEYAACAESLLESTSSWNEKTVGKTMIGKMTQRVKEDLSAQERRVAENCHTEHALAMKKKLAHQIKQLMARITGLESGVV